MVIEEKFVNGKNIHPLRAVGWEGFFGAIILSILLVPFYYIVLPETFCGSSYEPALDGKCRLEDAIDGLYQMGNNPVIIAAVLMNVISIAFFNFFGLSVTKTQSATTRMVLDSIRTIVIWAFCLAIGWETVMHHHPISHTLIFFFSLQSTQFRKSSDFFFLCSALVFITIFGYDSFGTRYVCLIVV